MSASLAAAYRMPGEPDAMALSVVGDAVQMGMNLAFHDAPATPVALLVTAQAIPAVCVPRAAPGRAPWGWWGRGGRSRGGGGRCPPPAGAAGKRVGSFELFAKFQPRMSSTKP